MKTFFLGIALLTFGATSISAQTDVKPPVNSSDSIIHAVEFPANADWLNSSGKIYMTQLKDRFVLLNFWTFSSFICLSQIKDLEKLQEQFPNLAIIVVHNGKYEGENETAYVKNGILQNNIPFLTINDSEFQLWKDYNIDSWPSNVLISPAGEVVLQSSGSKLSPDIATIIESHESSEKLRPVAKRFEGALSEQNILSYPSFLESDGDLFVFISDSRNHRIVVRDSEGNMDRIIGNGYAGKADGKAFDCSLRWPRGMAYDKNTNLLYIADTGNDMIRAYDMEKDTLVTILGNGERGFDIPAILLGMNQSINQPVDLQLAGDLLYITMTGWNQIWTYNIKTSIAEPVAGTGEFGFSEGKALESQLAEPIALAMDDEGIIYFTERQSSSIRSLDKDKVSTIIGSGIFDFGDSLVSKKEVLLQGPCGLTYYKGFLYVADEFNNKVKEIDPYRKRMKTFIGNGESGFVDGKIKVAQLNHPVDVLFVKDKLYVSDAYNHSIRTYDLDRDNLSTLGIGNLDRIPLRAINTSLILETDTLLLPEGDSRIELTFTFKEGHEFYSGAPNSVSISSRSNNYDVIYTTLQKNKTTFLVKNDGTSTFFIANFRVFYRSKEIKEDVYFKDFELMIPYRTSTPASDMVKVTYEIPLF